MLQQSIALSVMLGFLSVEFLGLSVGGLVAPGYLAFFVEQPLRIASTLALSALIAVIVRVCQRWIIIYGRRRFMAVMLLSLGGTWAVEGLLFTASGLGQDLRVIGYVIPGLIANDMLKQGIIKTALAGSLCACLIRLILLAASAL